MKRIIILIFLAFSFMRCVDFVEPGRDNVITRDDVIANPVLAEGVLLEAYTGFAGVTDFTEPATDDALSNDLSNSYALAAQGAWTSTINPFSRWSQYKYIGYINYFLDRIVDETQWAYTSEWMAEHLQDRLKGEAYALRAWYHYQILEAHAGRNAAGVLLGVPFMDMFVETDDYLSYMERPTYEDCVELILQDLDKAIAVLPDIYANATSGDNMVEYNNVYGARMQNRFSGVAAKFLKAKLLLHTASPAFNPADDAGKWEAAAEVITVFGGTGNLDASRIEYYLSPADKDILWRLNQSNTRNVEEMLFPPSLYGQGRINPSQNIVDAFPDKDGYPIDEGRYDFAAKPYTNRDPRLAKYVVYNGATLKTSTINTVDHPQDGYNKTEFSTVSGYYLKKFTNSAVNIIPGGEVNAIHFKTLMRYTEAFLAYAESANEAWGPDGASATGYSARDVMAALRSTAGITSPDQYLNDITTKEDMRLLIRNERRIELSFEGMRFWDLRRWNDIEKMKEPVFGTDNGGLGSVAVAVRNYEDYMIYGPLPYEECTKGVEQNNGWN